MAVLDPAILKIVGFAAIALLVLGWLVVSFMKPGPGRSVVEWSAATSMYVALLCLFLNLLRRALESDSTAGLVAFGFLTALFASGLCVSLVNVFRSLSGAGPGQESATH